MMREEREWMRVATTVAHVISPFTKDGITPEEVLGRPFRVPRYARLPLVPPEE